MAFAPTPRPYRFTVEEYLAFERTSSERHEYLDGMIYALGDSSSPQAMAGESEEHGIISTNLSGILFIQLRGTPCRVFSKDTKVRCGPYRPHTREGLSAYPDLLIVCGPSQYHDQVRDVLLNPTVLIDILLPSTETYDRGEKWCRYRTWLPTLTDYVLVAQDCPRIEHHHRQEDGTWTVHQLEGLQATLHLSSVGCTLPLAEVYERIRFSSELGKKET
jgi:Uma2 family endonuclease